MLARNKIVPKTNNYGRVNGPVRPVTTTLLTYACIGVRPNSRYSGYSIKWSEIADSWVLDIWL